METKPAQAVNSINKIKDLYLNCKNKKINILVGEIMLGIKRIKYEQVKK